MRMSEYRDDELFQVYMTFYFFFQVSYEFRDVRTNGGQLEAKAIYILYQKIHEYVNLITLNSIAESWTLCELMAI